MKEESHIPHFHQSSPIIFDVVQVIEMIVRQIITNHLCFIILKFENPTDLVTWFVTWMSLQGPGLWILASCPELNPNTGRTARRSKIYCIITYSKDKRPSNSKLLLDHAVNKKTWIQTLKEKNHRIDEILQMLNSWICQRSCEAGATVQRKNSNLLPKISKSKMRAREF